MKYSERASAITDSILRKSLPFDQFSRQEIVKYMIEKSFRSSKKSLKIIDLGGHKGQTKVFQSKDKVTILDVFDEEYEGYVKGDATKLTFSDNSFDIACSFDVFEHIPREKRHDFLSEALRVSKYGVFLAMPIDVKKKVSAAENLLNDFYNRIFDTDHPWLKEHIDYKIPTSEEIHSIAGTLDAQTVSLSSNQIGDWQLMQMLIFSAAPNPKITSRVNNINAWYNTHSIELDSITDTGYRGIFFITREKKYAKLMEATVKDFSSKKTSSDADKITINKKTFEKFSNTLAGIMGDYAELYKDYIAVSQSKKSLIEERQRLNDSIDGFRAQNDNYQKELDAIRSSFSWRVTSPMRRAKRIISGLVGR